VAYFWGAQKAGDAAHAASSRQLQIIALDLEATLERYETLPYVLSFQSEAAQALKQPGNTELIRRFNLTLRDIQRQAKVAAVYLMDPTGKTVAASNWDTAQDYTGKNFGFRPYFLDALRGGAGRFYGIGSTTSEPGYFIAQPVYDSTRSGKALGVVAVKISLDYLAGNWQTIEDPVVLEDRWGVIFLSNRVDWRYRSLKALPSAARQEIEASMQYIGATIEPLMNLQRAPTLHPGTEVTQGVGRLGWNLAVYPSQKPVVRAGLLWAFTALLLYAIALVSVWAVHQRNRRLEERGLAKQALQQAAEDLDCRIAQRTEELTRANSDVKARYTKLQETEHLLRSTQNELVQAGKLTMLGQMAAGVTHELNQPLTAIRAFADNARTFLERDQQQRVEQNLSHISAAAERMGAIIGQLKGFARKSDAALDTVDLAQSIRASALLLESDFQKAGASLQFDMPQTVQVSGDAVRIEQVLINLMRNALDAVKSSGVKTVVVSLEQDGTDALVRVADSGPGIADDVAQRLFEPFFSTKGSGEGLGLGLAISSSIVQALNGRLTAANRQTDGAVPGAEFSLWLPLAMQRSGAQQPLKVRPM
jgi:two-component system C4-dicarboxylate transport sensor histidine kinase DctB